MPPKALVSVEEYLHASYYPDSDYVDGRFVERNLGELDHSDFADRDRPFLYPAIPDPPKFCQARKRSTTICASDSTTYG
jgi:hypothetical protein